MSRYADALDCTSSIYEGRLTIDGVALTNADGAWHTPDLSALWSTPEQRGANRLLPGIAGVKAYKKRNTQTEYALPFVAVGAVDRLGNFAAEGDQPAQLEENLTYLFENVALPTNTGDGTRSCTWTLPSGSSIVADVHVVGLRGSVLPGAIYRGTLELSVPGGDLHLGA